MKKSLEDFVLIWQSSHSLAEAAHRLGLTKSSASVYASRLRCEAKRLNKDLPLKRFKAGRSKVQPINDETIDRLKDIIEGEEK